MRLLSGYIKQYYDTSLDWRESNARMTLRAELDRKRQAIIDRYADDLAGLEQTYAALRAKFATRMEGYTARLADVRQAMSDDLEAVAPDLDGYPIPYGREADEIGEGLFNSQGDYPAPLSAYKAHQGKRDAA